MSVDTLLEGLTKPQREAVTHTEGPLLVVAGPGSGKTRVITHRAAYLVRTVTRPHHILTVTFTNKAAGEMAERIQRLDVAPGITCCTFHSFCARLLRMHGDRAGLGPGSFSIFDESDQRQAMKQAIERRGLAADNFPPAKMLSRISRLKNDMVSPGAFAERVKGWHDKQIASLYEAYNQVLTEQNALDFDDLLVRTALLLGQDDELRGQLAERYRYILVDEYQDTNHAQYVIAQSLALDHENLCVTGDPDQSIYAWRGANLRNILDFEQDFPEARVVRLEQNYRSTPQILEAADALIARNRKRKKKALWTENAAGPPVRVCECEDHHVEAELIGDEIVRHVEAGGSYADVAVFYRVNALSRNLEGALRARTIPYQIARGVEFYNRKEIKDILAYLKVTANPRDQVALLRIINTPARGIGKTTVTRVLAHAEATGRTPLDVLHTPEEIPDTSRAAPRLRAFAELMTELAKVAGRGSVQDAVEFVLRRSGLVVMWGTADDESALENAHELVSAAAEYDRQPTETEPPADPLGEWLHQVSLVSDTDAVEEGSGVVTLMTLHAAKGLEFDTVFMAGLEDGLLPHERSQQEQGDIEEERRLCFVGMTRARRALTLTLARWREIRGVSHRTTPSPFLRELPKARITWQKVGEGRETGYDAADDLPASAVDYLEWRQGQLVRHAEYGLGRVMWIRPTSGRTHAGIHFNDHGDKTLILEYQDLDVVESDGP